MGQVAALLKQPATEATGLIPCFGGSQQLLKVHVHCCAYTRSMLASADVCPAALLLPWQVGVGRDGHPLLYGPPLVQLAGEFPLQPPLMGNLVPQSVNMWMGCAPDGE